MCGEYLKSIDLLLVDDIVEAIKKLTKFAGLPYIVILHAVKIGGNLSFATTEKDSEDITVALEAANVKHYRDTNSIFVGIAFRNEGDAALFKLSYTGRLTVTPASSLPTTTNHELYSS